MQAAGSEPDKQRWLAALCLVVAAGSLLLQYAILMRATQDAVGPGFATVRFLSYFTILSNFLVVFATASALLGSDVRVARFFRRADVKGGIALYIGVTGTIYFLILRHLWQPQGAQWWADTGLHYATPVLYLAWWLFGARHGALRWGDIVRWLAFPLAYLLWTFLRGAWVHEYPYPFIDVGQLGWTAVIGNATGILAVFLGLGAAFVAIDRRLGQAKVL